MSNEKPLKVAYYCRVATDEQAEPSTEAMQKEQFATALLQQLLKEQEVLSCRRYKLLNR